MVVDISLQNMSIDELYYTTMHRVDAIIYEAEMSIALEEYYSIQEDEVVLEDGSRSVIEVVKSSIKKIVNNIINFFVGLKRSIVQKINKIKADYNRKVQVKKLVEDIQNAINDCREDYAKYCKDIDNASSDAERKSILDKFNNKWKNVTKSFKERANSLNVKIVRVKKEK